MASYSELYHIFFNYVQPFGWDSLYNLVRSACYEDETEWVLRWFTARESLQVAEGDFCRFARGLAIVVDDLDFFPERETLVAEPTLEDQGQMMESNLPLRDDHLLVLEPVPNANFRANIFQ